MFDASTRLAVLLGFSIAACQSDHTETACDRWKVAVKVYASCNSLVYPPVQSDDDIVCKTDQAVADAAKAAPASNDIADLTSIDLCTSFIDSKRGQCTQWQTSPGKQSEYYRYVHCTFEIVKSWSHPTSGTGCERWKAAANYFHSCDPAVFPALAAGAQCVSDAQVSALTNGRFKTVNECADYIYDRAYPCAISLQDRSLCSNLYAATP